MHASDDEDVQARRAQTSSKLLWGRITELEDLQRKLGKMEDLLVELVELHQDIVARVSEAMREAVATATGGTQLYQLVDTPFHHDLEQRYSWKYVVRKATTLNLLIYALSKAFLIFFLISTISAQTWTS
ncbi:hypothetical protein JG687_00019700 [Phytophthora cactorum]|uniref:Uncharacterized protein n=1 Tax=Phytophthora cactorum TaxID=29920 RepID=A0A329REU9_9STRA|nr:hypothetical protein Pcac1_g6610 [Phytophthora cactorum]KAG2825799.1 hypothetical protein PC112_g9539 [Phytophthora cactorum]KAG2873529.1 hypothetical protein PC114_g25804 [Phytophthora cactorum]KAG2878926.1 hypothetical protein PC115_g22931 [Phytophthora cactorum]KAG2885403.1 hypothetical protein PC117_g25602 [Phytophthora cactorum]